jgi:hypothetical protein
MEAKGIKSEQQRKHVFENMHVRKSHHLCCNLLIEIRAPSIHGQMFDQLDVLTTDLQGTLFLPLMFAGNTSTWVHRQIDRQAFLWFVVKTFSESCLKRD